MLLSVAVVPVGHVTDPNEQTLCLSEHSKQVNKYRNTQEVLLHTESQEAQ